MILKIWNENTAGDSDDQLYVRLKPNKTGRDIILYVCDKQGQDIEDGNLMHIDNDYKVFILLDGINDKVPLKTTLRDSILTHKVDEVIGIQKERAMELLAERMASELKRDKPEEATRTAH